MSEWQPIETAPRCGGAILVHYHGAELRAGDLVACWSGNTAVVEWWGNADGSEGGGGWSTRKP